MTPEEIHTINNLLIEQLDKIIALSTKEIIQSTDHEESIEHLCHKLIKLKVKELTIKKRILASIRHNQKRDYYVL
jgi:hypothetical protein